MAELVLDSVSQSYGNRQIIADLSFHPAPKRNRLPARASAVAKPLRCAASSASSRSRAVKSASAAKTVSRPGWMLAAESATLAWCFQDYALFHI